MQYLKKLISVLILLPAVSYANFTISPIKVMFKPGMKVSSITVKNDAATDKHFQLSLLKVENKDGADMYVESKDLMLTPVMFKVAAKKSQLVRVAMKEGSDFPKGSKYVVSIKELPHGEIEANTVKFVTEFRVPVVFGEEKEEKKE